MHFVPIPYEIGERLSAARHRRLVVTLNGHEFRRALHGLGDGAYHVKVGRAVLRDLGLAYGETVIVTVRLDDEPNRVDLGEELEAALARDSQAMRRFQTFSTGKQRSLALYVTGAKRPETRARRATELANKIRMHTLASD